jgi:hypothetical protein
VQTRRPAIYTNSSVVSAGLEARHKVADLGTWGADTTCEQGQRGAQAPDDADGLSTRDAHSVRHGDRVVLADDLPEVPRGSELVVEAADVEPALAIANRLIVGCA